MLPFVSGLSTSVIGNSDIASATAIPLCAFTLVGLYVWSTVPLFEMLRTKFPYSLVSVPLGTFTPCSSNANSISLKSEIA